ncbi:MAG: gliding motility-associated C-terminal domain-containing protein, partial [Fimbriimonadaceae bacterium]|nr:gliding motility-associated C-terminal domain-containing protein [Chitinophagales bacterium]
DENGCVNIDTVIVNSVGEITIYIFNAFSPNADGLNDTYYPIVQGSGTLVDYTIFNRWGEVVYTGGPADMGLGKGWNGELNGKTADIGSYVIIVNAVTSLGDAKFSKGSFLLVR